MSLLCPGCSLTVDLRMSGQTGALAQDKIQFHHLSGASSALRAAGKKCKTKTQHRESSTERELSESQTFNAEPEDMIRK